MGERLKPPAWKAGAPLSGRVLRTENQRAARLEVLAEDVTERRALEEQLRQVLKGQ
jgi:hypothetical protein